MITGKSKAKKQKQKKKIRPQNKQAKIQKIFLLGNLVENKLQTNNMIVKTLIKGTDGEH